MSGPKYPGVVVQLSGQDGNAMAVIARVTKAMGASKISAAEREAFVDEAMSGDYDNLLRTCMRYVQVR